MTSAISIKNVSTRLALVTCVIAGALQPAVTLGDAPAELTGRRPNIILILTDDQGYGDLGRHGNPVIKTPHLDRLYDEAVRFEDYHVSPTCAPTRSALLSGRHEFRSGVTHTIYERERMSLATTTIVEILKSAGYTTGIFGKWHLGDEEPYQPGNRGFDEVFIHGAGGIGQTYPGSCGDAPANSYFDPVILHNGTFVKTDGYCTDVFFNQAMKWIETNKGQQPFFCYLATNAPHSPHHVPEEYEKMYAQWLASQSDNTNPQDAAKGPDQSKKASANIETARFLGMITNIDDNVGRLMGKIREWGIDRDTLVIFMTDNGGTAGCRIFNAGMKGTKGTAHNGGTRAMSLWRWPGALKPASVPALTAHLDVFPTLAQLAGAKLSEETASELEGFSLVPLLRNAGASWPDDRMLFTHVGRWERGTPPDKFGRCSVRWRDYLYFPKPEEGELYDLRADPGETTNIIARHPDVAAKLATAYDRWWKGILPDLVNEEAYKTAPSVNPFKEWYWEQYQGPGPNNAPRETKTSHP
ncbi:MAG: arylsulfatase [Phycisphaerales bacterium]|nr:arylsulfatase [Phycisphaerales bacterium]